MVVAEPRPGVRERGYGSSGDLGNSGSCAAVVGGIAIAEVNLGELLCVDEELVAPLFIELAGS